LQYNHIPTSKFSILGILKFRWIQDKNFQGNPSTGNWDTARWCIVMQVKCPWLLLKCNPVYIACNQCVWGGGMDLQEDTFPGNRESDKKLHCSSSKVLIITDGS